MPVAKDPEWLDPRVRVRLHQLDAHFEEPEPGDAIHTTEIAEMFGISAQSARRTGERFAETRDGFVWEGPENAYQKRVRYARGDADA